MSKPGSAGDDAGNPGFWQKLEISGKVAVPVVLAVIALQAESFVSDQSRIASSREILAELVAQREGADSQLRKDMFAEVLKAFVGNTDASQLALADRILNLEILTYNFHESIDLRPLFYRLYREAQNITSGPASLVGTGEPCDLLSPAQERDKNRLATLGLNTHLKEYSIIEEDPRSVVFNDRISAWAGDQQQQGFDLGIEGYRRATLDIVEINQCYDRLQYLINLENDEGLTTLWGYVDPFTFPLMHHIRLGDGVSFALVIIDMSLDDTKPRYYRLAAVQFPNDIASFRDRPQYEDTLRRILDAETVIGDRNVQTTPGWLSRLRTSGD